MAAHTFTRHDLFAFGGRKEKGRVYSATFVRTLYMGLFSLLFGCGTKDEPYHKHDGQWRFEKAPLDVSANANVAVLAKEFAMVDGAVFYRSTRIDSADASTFTMLSEHYAKDRHAVFYCDTYRKGQDYYLIKYDRVSAITGANAASIRVLEQDYAVDDHLVYYEGVAMREADAASFEVLAPPYARDHAHGYFRQTPIKGSIGRTFVALDHYYAKDSVHVFYSNFGSEVPNITIVTGAQAASFVTAKLGYASDAMHHYYDANIVGDAHAPLELLEGSFYAKMGNVVLYRGQTVEGADAATFVMRAMPSPEGGDASDVHQSYSEGKPLSHVKPPTRGAVDNNC